MKLFESRMHNEIELSIPEYGKFSHIALHSNQRQTVTPGDLLILSELLLRKIEYRHFSPRGCENRPLLTTARCQAQDFLSRDVP